MRHSFLVVFTGVFLALSSSGFGGENPIAKACEDLKAEVGVSLISSEYSTFRTSIMSPCYFDKFVQFGVAFGWTEFPYIGDDGWDSVFGRELLFGFAVRQDLANSQDNATGVKVEAFLGRLQVESQKFKNKDFQDSKVNSLGESELAVGFYTTTKNWETNIGLSQRTFDTVAVYGIKGEILPRRDLGVKVAFSYLIN